MIDGLLTVTSDGLEVETLMDLRDQLRLVSISCSGPFGLAGLPLHFAKQLEEKLPPD